MSYAAMKECWLDLERAPASAFAEILPDHAEILGLAGPPGPPWPIDVGAGEPHVLLWATHPDLVSAASRPR